MITANFTNSQRSLTVEKVTQGDYGQKLSIRGLNLPLNVEVHFAISGDKNGIKMFGKTENNITSVDIPNLLLAEGKDIVAYIFVVEGKEGKTVRTIRIPVTPKPNIQEVELPPDDEDIVREMIVVVNDMKEIVDTIAYTEIDQAGLPELPIHTIADDRTSELSTWSSRKLNDEFDKQVKIHDNIITNYSTWSSQEIDEKFHRLQDEYLGRDYLRTIVVQYPDMGPGLSLGVDVEYPPGFTIENSVVLTYSCKYVRYYSESNQTNKVKIPHTQPEDVSIYLYPNPSTGTLKGAISNIGQAGTFVLKDIYLAITFLCIDKKG